VSSWPDAIFDQQDAFTVRQVAYVSDAGHSRLITRCAEHPEIRSVPLLAGAWPGGRRGVLLMQSSGVGNCINMLSLIRECRLPHPALTQNLVRYPVWLPISPFYERIFFGRLAVEEASEFCNLSAI